MTEKKRYSKSDMEGQPTPSSDVGGAIIDLSVKAQPQEADNRLPEAYGIPLLEFLVVDTEFAFFSWEITAQQLDELKQQLGDEDFKSRRLVLHLRRDSPHGAILLTQDFFGEQGRWFLRHDHAGSVVSAVLGYQCQDKFIQLNTAGPVELPRTSIVEPESYDELRVRYSYDADGRLVLAKLDPAMDAAWPEPHLPQPSPAEFIRQLSVRMPGSLARPRFGVWPASTWSPSFSLVDPQQSPPTEEGQHD